MRIIETQEELDALPEGAVIRTGDEKARWRETGVYERWGNGEWREAGVYGTQTGLTLPAMLLWPHDPEPVSSDSLADDLSAAIVARDEALAKLATTRTQLQDTATQAKDIQRRALALEEQNISLKRQLKTTTFDRDQTETTTTLGAHLTDQVRALTTALLKEQGQNQ